MIGNQPSKECLNINLEELVLPQNLIAEESLSPDVDPEEEERQPFSVDTFCGTCNASVRLCITATSSAVCLLRVLLQGELAIICVGCSKGRLRHGRLN
uniref:Protein E7 n=1 Tax=Human papillomavirus TaxID=10566 RepID=A0A385PM01_9PAPI|nr:MAG: E7 protein [Human papillomavirus]